MHYWANINRFRIDYLTTNKFCSKDKYTLSSKVLNKPFQASKGEGREY